MRIREWADGRIRLGACECEYADEQIGKFALEGYGFKIWVCKLRALANKLMDESANRLIKTIPIYKECGYADEQIGEFALEYYRCKIAVFVHLFANGRMGR